MAYHPYLERQIRKFLPKAFRASGELVPFLNKISETYNNYDRDRELSEHAFSINEMEYEKVNQQLRELTKELEDKVKQRTQELSEIARFPAESPNPVYRISETGKIIYANDAAFKIKSFIYNGLYFSPQEFFLNILNEIKDLGNIEVDSDEESYLFYYIKAPGKTDINFYGTNVTERNQLRKKSYDNFYRLSSFLESTDDAYYVIYSKFKDKSFVTSKWGTFYGFNPAKVKDIIQERGKCVRSDYQSLYFETFSSINLGDKKTFRYCAINQKTKEEYWVEELVSKQYDSVTGDIIITGRISDVTKEELYSMRVMESEERFRLMMDSVPMVIWVSDEKEKLVYSNLAANTLFATPLNNAEKITDLIDQVHPDDKKIALKSWGSQNKKQQAQEAEFRVLDHKNQYRNIFQKVVPRFYADGTFAGYIGAFFDLTSEKEYQKMLYEEKEKLNLLTKNSPDIIILANDKGTIDYISPSVERVLGYKPEYLVGKNIKSLIQKKYFTDFKEALQSPSFVQQNKFLHCKMITQNKNLIWVESAISIIKQKNTVKEKILFHIRDINSIKIAELALQESEEKYRALFDNMSLGIMEVDTNEKIVWVNESFENMTGYPLSSIKGKVAQDIFLKTESQRHRMHTINEQRKKKRHSAYEIQLSHKSGRQIDVIISGSPVIDLTGNVKGSVGIHWDVSEIRSIQKKLAEEQLIKEREILKASLNAEEKQREILGRDLHDSVGQMLTYLSLYLQRTSETQKFEASNIALIQDNIIKALNEVRRISRSLVPPALTDLGLKEAIFELISQYEKLSSIRFTFKYDTAVFNKINFNAQSTIYRIIQELINNTSKYANAQNVDISIVKRGKNLEVHYSDDGKGFDPTESNTGVGLKSINSRTQFYGGQVMNNSRLNRGANFIIKLPMLNVNSNGKEN